MAILLFIHCHVTRTERNSKLIIWNENCLVRFFSIRIAFFLICCLFIIAMIAFISSKISTPTEYFASQIFHNPLPYLEMVDLLNNVSCSVSGPWMAGEGTSARGRGHGRGWRAPYWHTDTLTQWQWYCFWSDEADASYLRVILCIRTQINLAHSKRSPDSSERNAALFLA